MKALAGFLILALIFPLQLFAAEVSVNFTSRTLFESGTAVWNQALGKAHPALQVVNYTGGGAFTPRPFSVGDGSDGLFDISTYAHFSLNGDLSGNKIRLDTSRYPVLNVTRFHLAPGWVLEPTGNVPLVIYSLSDVRIEGEVWCQGRKGGDAVGATPGAGGLPRCGGQAGGSGGSVGQNGTNGADVNASVTGGEGGNHVTGANPSVGGGGGGAWNTSGLAADGDNVNASGGHAGTSRLDPEFLTIGGGAGGGGGGSTDTEAGAGGGAGGGVVIIHAVGNVEIGTSPASATGFIFANGGDGGSSDNGGGPGTGAGGPGGGGGGGSVQVFSGDTINIYNQDADGASQANIGNGGNNSNAPNPAFGGKGRSWFASVNYFGAAGAYYSPGEQLPVQPDINTVEFINDGNQNVITKSFDLESTMASIDSYTFTPSSADFQAEFKASSDNFVSDDTGWTTDLSLVSHKRYLKMKLKIATSTPFNPTMMDQVRVAFTPSEKRDFDFKSSGCGLTGSAPPPGSSGWALFLMTLPFGLLLTVRYRFRLRKS